MRYFIGILVTIGLIVLIIFLLFRGGGSGTTVKPLTLLDYAHQSADAQLIIDGPVVADQNHQEVQIDVTSDHVNFTLYNTYTHQVATSQSYNNNDTAFAVFLQALQHAGYTLGNTDKALRDERGVCPTGTRNIYTFTASSKQLMRFWSTSCGDGTSKGKTGTLTTLFKRQVPDYAALTKGVTFASEF